MDTLRLTTDRLSVEIARPGTMYKGTRFDWSGFITQVTLKGADGAEHTFCVPESLVEGEGTGGIGLCNEFGIDMPIGYDEAQPGEPFVKLGIGLLLRPDGEPYNFFRPHEIATPFPIQVQANAAQATFIIEPVACRGYAAHLTKVLSVAGAELKLEYALENVGEKPLVTNEYCHNFMGFDSQPIGPHYTLSFPYPIVMEQLPGMPAALTELLELQGNTMRCREEPQHAFYTRLIGAHATDQPQWELEYAPTGLRMSETDDFAPMRVAVWGTAHVVSAEEFAAINVAPGDTYRWSRRYNFSAR